MWIYQQNTGNLYYTKKEYSQFNSNPDPLSSLPLISTGYSGRDLIGKDSQIHGKNNSEAESIKNFGPIPRGLWYMTNAVDGTQLGPRAIKLVADKQTQTFQRSGFYIHGDNWRHCASEGCIIMAGGVREKLDQSDDKILLVVQ